MWRCRPSALRSNTGFSLVELMVTMSLLGIFFGLVYESLITSLRVVDASENRETIRRDLLVALDRFTRDASVANNVDNANQLDGNDTGEFQFDTPSVNNVEYAYDASAETLSYDDLNVTQRVIARNLTSFDLAYYDLTGTQLSEPVAGSSEGDIRVVRLVATATVGTETITVASAAYLRNM